MVQSKKIILAAALTLSAVVSHAQQDPMYTHYMYNTLAVNPAYAGSREALTLTGLYRNQWVGFDGAPKNITFTGHTPIGNAMGLGLSFVNDKIGPITNNQIYADLAYHLKLNAKSKLSFGLKGGVNLFSGNLTTLKTTSKYDANNPSDPATALGSVNNQVTPNIGAGLYYYRDRFYMGISSPKLLQNKIGTTEVKFNGQTQTTNLIQERLHYFGIIGAMFDLSPNVQLKPTALIKITEAAPVEGDFTATFVFAEKFNLGAMYRTGDAVGVLLGFNVTPQWNLGYSYDWSFVSKTGFNKTAYNTGSHEVMMRYDLIYKDKSKIKSPRYF
jgi:type IX secretion system PorP/SprF family membrane protein